MTFRMCLVIDAILLVGIAFVLGERLSIVAVALMYVNGVLTGLRA